MERRVEETTLRVKPRRRVSTSLHCPSSIPFALPPFAYVHLSTIDPDAKQDNNALQAEDQQIDTMSSPSHRRQRSSQSGGTPKRSSRQSEAATPRNARASQLASSPMFFQSSSPGREGSGANQDVSSPLRQMSNSQSTHQQTAVPSSPLGQMTDSQSTDGQRTPRASGMAAGGEPYLTKVDSLADF